MAWLACVVAIAALPESKIAYKIDVALEPETRKLIGEESIRWTNPSTITLDRLRLHLYLNAFENDQTTWMSEAFSQGALSDLLEVWPEPWGWIDVSEIRQRAGELRIGLQYAPISPDDGNTLDRTLIEVQLAQPIAPGTATEIEVAFEAQLPHIIARTGAVQDFFAIAQWYPKMAVFETPGVRGALRPRWAARQFHARAEFYADFADYDVAIKAPEDWLIAATGQAAPGNPGTRRFVQRSVHDFVWATAPSLVEVNHTITPKRGEPIVVRYVGPEGTAALADRLHPWTALFFDVLSERVGPYPFKTFTVVIPTPAAIEAAGMEYPTLIFGHPIDPLFEMTGFLTHQGVIAHELAHQWFQGLLASNEADEGFLDEGVTTYWEDVLLRAGAEKFGVRHTVLGRRFDDMLERTFPLNRRADVINAPIVQRPSYLHGRGNYLQVYLRLPTCLETVQRRFGQQTITTFFQRYYQRFAFRHPGVEDFLSAGEAIDPAAAAFLRECVLAARVPAFSVLSLESSPYQEPEGHFTGKKARDVMSVTDFGHVRETYQIEGHVEQIAIRPAEAAEEEWFSEASIQGPGWDHLPVTVELHFSDGFVFREVWDGASQRRGYQTLRGAKLIEVRIDPENEVAVDVNPVDDGLRREPNTALVDDWSAWWAAIASWLARSTMVWL